VKLILLTFLSPLLLLANIKAIADEPADNTEIMAQRGKGIVTYQSFNARANMIPAEDRLPTLRNGSRLQDVLASLLLRSQLAAEAHEAGFDQEQVIIDRMQLAAETELAAAWLNHYVEMQPAADYEQLAYEKFQLSKEKILSSPKIDVSHILISQKNARTKLQANLPGRFGRNLWKTRHYLTSW